CAHQFLIGQSSRETACPAVPELTGSGGRHGWLAVEAAKHQAGIRAAETKAVGHHTVELHAIEPLTYDRDVLERSIELVDICALADEAVIHHEKREDRLLYANCAKRMTGQRLGGRDVR